MAERGTDWGSMVAGLLFVGLAVALVLRGTGDWSFGVWWLLPVLVAGLALAGVARGLSRRSAEHDRGAKENGGASPED